MATQEAKVFVQENGEKRELVGEELAAYLAQAELDKVAFQAEKAAIEILKTKKEEILNRLGITEDEAKLLLS